VFRAVLVVAALLVLPTSGQAGTPRPVGLIAFGDFGVGGATQQRFGAGIRRFESRNPADYLVALGDNDYTESPAQFQTNWKSSFGWASSAGVNVAGVLGNHDVRVQGGRYEFEALRMPARYYRRAVGAVELYLLDSNDVGPAQTAWLRRTLARSKARWRIAALHHPPYSCGQYAADDEILRRWAPLFERYRVQLVLSGHDHNYQRFAPRRGVRYVVHGGGGRKLYSLSRCPSSYPRRQRARVEHGFLYVVIRPSRIDGYSVTPSGRRTDHFVVPS
jgi:3',5'-cyclic AMP phosphodiesterase CpdA